MILRVDIGPRSLRSCVETTILNLVYYYRPTTWVFERDFMRVRPPLGVTVLLQSLWYYFLGRIFGETSSRRNGVWRRRSARVSAGRKRAIKALPFFPSLGCSAIWRLPAFGFLGDDGFSGGVQTPRGVLCRRAFGYSPLVCGTPEVRGAKPVEQILARGSNRRANHWAIKGFSSGGCSSLRQPSKVFGVHFSSLLKALLVLGCCSLWLLFFCFLRAAHGTEHPARAAHFGFTARRTNSRVEKGRRGTDGYSSGI
jgi:hypothetical protein